MEICASCSHILALHAGPTGKCRLNGCRCGAYSPLRTTLPEGDQPEPTTTAGPRPAVPWSIFLSGVAFLAGLLVGLSR